MEINIQVHQSNDQTVLKVAGEIDAFTSPQLKETIYSHLSEGKQDLLIDLSGVSYLDSTGLGVLVAVFKAVKKNGGNFVLTGLSSRLLRLFTITGLSEIMEIKGEV